MLFSVKDTKNAPSEATLFFIAVVLTLQSQYIDFIKPPRCYGKHSILTFVFASWESDICAQARCCSKISNSQWGMLSCFFLILLLLFHVSLLFCAYLSSFCLNSALRSWICSLWLLVFFLLTRHSKQTFSVLASLTLGIDLRFVGSSIQTCLTIVFLLVARHSSKKFDSALA